MKEPPTAAILVLAEAQSRAEGWCRMLEGPEFRVFSAADELPDPLEIDLIVTDGSTGGSAGRLAPSSETESRGPGVLLIGSDGPADVHLAEDVTRRELRLACRLAAEVVRLRQKIRRSEQSRRRLSAEALTDPLTGLPNRRAWDRALPERLDALADSSSAEKLCLAILDLDRFKPVNDSHGHAVGDEVLRAAGEALRVGLRGDDFVARLGGDEFGLLLTVPDRATAASVVDRVRASLPNHMARSATHAITASAGFHVVSPNDHPTADTLTATADAALRQAKQSGRNQTAGSL